MSTVSDRFGRVAAGFTGVVEAVDPTAWSNPSPCEGWTARDVVGHLVEWIPGPGFLLGSYDIDTGSVPSVFDDPGDGWATVRNAIQAGLDDPAVAARQAPCGPLGDQSFEDAVDITVIGDVFVHTWDLAQAAGIDPRLDAEELRQQYDAIAAIAPDTDAAMRSSGHFGPRFPVTADADLLDVVLAFYGRNLARWPSRPHPSGSTS